MDLFDWAEGNARKEHGMQLAESNRQSDLDLARSIAVELATRAADRTITADDVGRVLKRRHDIDSLGPAAGSLFKGDQWKWTGEYRKSVRTTNHGRMLRVWKLITEAE